MLKMKDSGIEWIGEIPEEWEIHTVLQLFVQVKCKNAGMQENNLLSLSYGKIINKDINGTDGLLPESFEGYNIIEPNDIVLRLTDLQNDHTSLRVGISEQKGIITSAYLTMRNQSQSHPKYLYYQLHTFDICKGLYGMGAGVRQGLNWDGIKLLKLVVPSTNEQQKIADYLDQQCAAIDAVLEKTHASIEEYKKLKQVVITEAVTKGIRGDRPMKDSGIEWVMSIPCEWNSINPKALFTQRKEKAYKGERQLTASQQYGVIYQGDYMELTGSKVVTVEKDFDILKHVEAGDFVISMRSFQGGLEYSTNTGSISSAYVMLIPNLEYVYPRFYRWLLKSEVYINALQSTSNMVRDGQAMRYSNFSQVRLYSVPLDEQKEIADYLDDKCNKIDTLIAKKTQFLTELENYKKSLVYEYVTGKKEVEF
jgi:type I restriction enzyme S subunit